MRPVHRAVRCDASASVLRRWRNYALGETSGDWNGFRNDWRNFPIALATTVAKNIRARSRCCVQTRSPMTHDVCVKNARLHNKISIQTPDSPNSAFLLVSRRQSLIFRKKISGFMLVQRKKIPWRRK